MKRLGKAVAMGVAASLFLSACTTTGAEKSSLSPAEQRLRQQADTFNQTVVEGAVAGCVAGLLIGVLASSNNPAKGAMTGCAAGAAAGGAAGYYVANKQEQYANREQRLDAMIADVQKDNQRLTQMIDTSRQVIADDTQTLETLKKRMAAGSLSKDKAHQELARIDENTKYMTQTIARLKERQSEYRNADKQTEGSGERKRVMEQEITLLERQIAQLEQDVNGLIQRRQVARIG